MDTAVTFDQVAIIFLKMGHNTIRHKKTMVVEKEYLKNIVHFGVRWFFKRHNVDKSSPVCQ